MTTAIAPNPYASLEAATANTKTANDAGSADRFLKLLVTQMQNQDPLNPMDNAQITSQMAQINTVNGIEKLNSTVDGLNGQFVQLQALTGASLVGRDVTVKGNRLSIKDGVGVAGFDLSGTADLVKVEVLNPGGIVVDTINLGAESAGRQSFTWPAQHLPDGADYRFRVVASVGAAAVPNTLLMRDRVEAVSTSGNSLVLETRHSGSVAYSDIKGFN